AARPPRRPAVRVGGCLRLPGARAATRGTVTGDADPECGRRGRVPGSRPALAAGPRLPPVGALRDSALLGRRRRPAARPPSVGRTRRDRGERRLRADADEVHAVAGQPPGYGSEAELELARR